MTDRRHPCIEPDSDSPRLSVLVADDQDINLRLMRLLLPRFDCFVASAGSGEEAVELALVAEFDLILMDLHMGDIDGDEATRRIRASGRSHRAFVASWTTDPAPRLDAGLYDGALVKPVTMNALAAVVKEARCRVLNREDSHWQARRQTSSARVR